MGQFKTLINHISRLLTWTAWWRWRKGISYIKRTMVAYLWGRPNEASLEVVHLVGFPWIQMDGGKLESSYCPSGLRTIVTKMADEWSLYNPIIRRLCSRGVWFSFAKKELDPWPTVVQNQKNWFWPRPMVLTKEKDQSKNGAIGNYLGTYRFLPSSVVGR